MQFLLICHDDNFEPADNLVAETITWVREMNARGIRKYGNALRSASDATTVRVRDDKLARRPGPFAPSEEKMCAYDLIECANMDAAVDVASRHPMAKVATIEVRPIWSDIS